MHVGCIADQQLARALPMEAGPPWTRRSAHTASGAKEGVKEHVELAADQPGDAAHFRGRARESKREREPARGQDAHLELQIQLEQQQESDEPEGAFEHVWRSSGALAGRAAESPPG